MSEFKQSEMIKSALEGVRGIIDSGAVLGNPIVTSNNVTIIPVSKISMGLATGGLDYSSKSLPSFGGGGGTGINVTPVGFLVVRASGSVELLTVDGAANKPTAVSIIDSVVELIENSPDIAEKIKIVIGKFKKDDEKSEGDEKGEDGETGEKSETGENRK